MAIDVLGPVSVEGATLYPRERAVLAALVLRDGVPISAEELAEALWRDEKRPATWSKQIPQAISRLRKALGADSIVTTVSGYHLDVDPEEIDARRFESLIERAREHQRDGERGRAVDRYRRALSLWRGRAYDDLGDWPEAVAAASDLTAQRVQAAEELLRARIDIGEADAVIPDAERLVRVEPLRESRWALLALALYRSGRQADALAALRSARERLADELGVDVGTEITDLETAILQHDVTLEPAAEVLETRTDCPYRGLGTYQDRDAGDFFGRDDEIAVAVRRLDATGLVVVTGASGSGKSSLVRAGVVPSYRRRGRRVLIVGPDPAIVQTLREAVNAGRRTDAVVVDQFEEILDAEEGVGAQVSALLADFVRDGGKAIITVRSDFLDRCAADPALGPLLAESVLVVSPMGDDDLRRVIEEPAARAGLRLEPGLVELMLRDAAGAAGVLPHLSHALAETWARREGPVLTVAGYEATGGIEGAIAQSADRLYSALDPEDQELCRTTLLRLVALAPDGLPVRRRIVAAPMRDDADHARVFSQLASARLVSVEDDTVVLAHESITRAWPRFRTWLQDGVEDLTVLGHLETGAEAWEEGGRLDDDLARGARLHAMLELRERSNPSLTPTETAFVEASAAHEVDEKRALAHAAEAERRQNRRLRLAIAGVAVIAIIAVVTGGLAIRSSLVESATAEDARIGELTSTSAALRDSEAVAAALLAAEAYRRWPDDARSRGALLALLSSSAGDVRNAWTPGTENLIGAAVIPGTESALVVRDNVHPEIRNVTTAELIESLDIQLPTPDAQRRPYVRVSSDGRIATVTSEYDKPGEPSGTMDDFGSWLSVIDLEAGELIREPQQLEQFVNTFSLSPDGAHAAYLSLNGDLVVIDTLSGEVRVRESFASAPDLPYVPGAVGFSPDSATMVVGSTTGELTTVDVGSLETTRSVHVPPYSAEAHIVVREDGSIVAGGESGTVAVGASGEVIWHQEALTADECGFLTVSPATESIFCGDQEGGVVERRLADGELTGRAISYQAGASGEIFVDESGTRLFLMTAGSPSIGTWHLDGSIGSAPMVVPSLGLALGPSPSGRYLLASQRPVDVAPQTFTVWDIEAGEAVYTVDGYDASWAGTGVLRTVTADRENYYVDLVTGVEVPAPQHDRDRFDGEDQWAEFWPNVAGDVLLEMDSNVPVLRQLNPSTGEVVGPELSVGDGWQGFSAASTPDGARVVVGNFLKDYTPQLTMFDAHTGTILAQATGPEYVIATITPDLEVFTGGFSGVERLSIDLEPLGALPSPPSGRIATLQSTDDARTMLVTSWSNDYALYDLPTSKMLGFSMQAPASAALPAAIERDGSAMFISTDRGVVRFSLDPEDWFAQACEVAGRNFSQQEWDTYMSGLGDYRATCTFPSE